jgi:hypothetical protein
MAQETQVGTIAAVVVDGDQVDTVWTGGPLP